MVHENTIPMNYLLPLFEKLMPLLEDRFPGIFRPGRRRRRRVEVQLEFPWARKR